MSATGVRIIRTAIAFVIGVSGIVASAQRDATVPPASSQAAEPPKLTIRFEGGEVAANAAAVLKLLDSIHLVRTDTRIVEKGDTLCGVYREHVAFPSGCSAALVSFAATFSGMKDGSQLGLGQSLTIPDVAFRRSQFSRRFDPHVESDKQQLEEVETHWRAYVRQKQQLATGDVKVTLAGWELQLPLAPADVELAIRALTDAQIPNVTFTHPVDQRKQAKYQSVFSPAEYRRACAAGPPARDAQCAYSLLVGVNRLGSFACQSKCPDVFLLDQPVRRDASLASVLDGSIDDDQPGPSQIAPCSMPDLKVRDHGTHLAGIIAGSGPVCLGLHNEARLHSWNSEADFAQTSQAIETVQGAHEGPMQSGLPIVVMASSWGYGNKNGQAGALLARESDRLVHPLVGPIRSYGSLWIVAAGQADPAKPEEFDVEITKKLALGPMNFGDERNVVVVTACTDCGTDRASLRPGSNYSSTMVHLAAPGDDMPGIAGNRRLAVGGGTSQAAAFVAGVASAMVSRAPELYIKPERAKARLQFTSRPTLSPADAERIATGIVDPAVALLDPRENYVQERGGEMRPVSLAGWCGETLTLIDPATGMAFRDGNIQTRNIYRLYRINRTEPGPGLWIVYEKVPWTTSAPGTVLRVGAGTLAVLREDRLLKLKDGNSAPSFVMSAAIDDLLVPALLPVSGGC